MHNFILSFFVKPNLLNPQFILSHVFNLHTFYDNHQYVTISDLLNFANIYSSNIYKYIQIYSNGIQFYQSINGISETVFSYVHWENGDRKSLSFLSVLTVSSNSTKNDR